MRPYVAPVGNWSFFTGFNNSTVGVVLATMGAARRRELSWQLQTLGRSHSTRWTPAYGFRRS